jgi:hypothetical protein
MRILHLFPQFPIALKGHILFTYKTYMNCNIYSLFLVHPSFFSSHHSAATFLSLDTSFLACLIFKNTGGLKNFWVPFCNLFFRSLVGIYIVHINPNGAHWWGGFLLPHLLGLRTPESSEGIRILFTMRFPPLVD